MKTSPFLLLGGLCLVGCVTINVYFPEEEIRDLSEQIEDEVQRRAQDEPAPEAARHRPPWISRLLGVEVAWASQQPEAVVPAPEVTNPAIRKIIDTRAERLPDLNRYKAAGVVGENNQALVEIRDLQKIGDLRQRAELQRLVKEENEDRERLYKEVAFAKGVDLSQLPLVRATYAETLRKNARPGDWIQMEDGSWKQK